MDTLIPDQIDHDIDRAIERWNAEKHYRVFPTSVSYSETTGKASLVFENGSTYQFNPLHIQEVTLETPNPMPDQLGNIIIRAGGESLHWPLLDASIGIDNLLLGRYGTDKWMLHLKLSA
ncbi:MAG: DUF2442 domain-containing protein [Phormidesmis sp.]